jgi:hypothetical protein
MKSIQDTTPDPRPATPLCDAPAYDEPSTDVNETPTAKVGDDAVTDAPMSPLEEIKRKYGPDILRPASQFPRKAAA